ncbi:MAG: hypothetical protein ACREOW_00280 [Thermodesulfobacteriota bacterium]
MKSWDSGQLWQKAKAYIDRANEIEHSSPLFPLWCALAVELLARAALTRTHPVLNADPRSDLNILYACGFAVAGQPRSLPAHSVFLRLEKTVPGFGKAQRELCDFLSLLRNQELHTADLAFENLKESKWLPRFYEVCRILCAALGHSLTEFLGDDLTPSAEKLVKALEEEIDATVKANVAACAKAFREKPAPEQVALRAEAKAALRQLEQGSKREKCPACESEGLLTGDLIKELEPQFIDGSLYVDEEYLAAGFRCLVCGLVLKNVQEITAAGMEPRFTEVRETSLHELYEPDWMYEYDNM